jgi:hypothetical protein
MIFEGETVMGDDEAVYWGAVYLFDGDPGSSDLDGTVADLKRASRAREIRRCEVAKRDRMRDAAESMTRLHREWEEGLP